jgi:hypothetical protein
LGCFTCRSSSTFPNDTLLPNGNCPGHKWIPLPNRRIRGSFYRPSGRLLSKIFAAQPRVIDRLVSRSRPRKFPGTQPPRHTEISHPSLPGAGSSPLPMWVSRGDRQATRAAPWNIRYRAPPVEDALALFHSEFAEALPHQVACCILISVSVSHCWIGRRPVPDGLPAWQTQPRRMWFCCNRGRTYHNGLGCCRSVPRAWGDGARASTPVVWQCSRPAGDDPAMGKLLLVSRGRSGGRPGSSVSEGQDYPPSLRMAGRGVSNVSRDAASHGTGKIMGYRRMRRAGAKEGDGVSTTGRKSGNARFTYGRSTNYRTWHTSSQYTLYSYTAHSRYPIRAPVDQRSSTPSFSVSCMRTSSCILLASSVVKVRSRLR